MYFNLLQTDPQTEAASGRPRPSSYQSTLRVITMIAARMTNSSPEPSTNALSSDTSRPYRAA